jgi:type I restriction enzyme S subunit
MNLILSNKYNVMQSLNDICTVCSSKRVKASEYKEHGIPFFRGKEINSKNTTDTYISLEKYQDLEKKYPVPKKNDILVSAIGTIGGIYQISENENIYFKDGNVLWLRSFSKNINPLFLKYLLSSKTKNKEIKKSCNGGIYLALTLDTLKKITIPNIPIESQEYISDILLKKENQINNIKLLIEKLEKRNQYYANKLLLGIFHVKEDEFNKLSIIENNEVSNFTNSSNVESIIKMIQKKKTFNIPKTDIKESGKFPVIGQEKTFISGFTDDSSKLIDIEKKGSFVVFGDHTTSAKYIDFDFVLGADGTQVFQTSDEVNLKFLYFLLKENILIKPQGYKRHFKDLKEKVFNYPCMEKQNNIVKILNDLYKEKEQIEKLLKLEQKQFDWLSEKLLSGEYRVVED